MSMKGTERKAPRKDNRKLISVPDEHPDTIFAPIPSPNDFEEQQSDFLRGKAIEAIATMQIDHYEAEFAHVRKLNIAYVWKRTGGGSKGQNTLGKCVKPSGLLKHFAGVDFVVWLAADHLRDMDATFWQVEAVVFHQLKHAQIDEQARPSIRGHDFEGFAREIIEYGAWHQAAEELRTAFKQLAFDFNIVPELEKSEKPA